jgi:hypothetical protein
MRISEQRLNQIINESIQESLNGMVSGFNAARHNYKGNKDQSFGNRVMNAANAGNQGYRLQEFLDAIDEVETQAQELSDSGFISDEQRETILRSTASIYRAMRDMSYNKSINVTNKPMPEKNKFDGRAKEYFGK